MEILIIVNLVICAFGILMMAHILNLIDIKNRAVDDLFDNNREKYYWASERFLNLTRWALSLLAALLGIIFITTLNRYW